MMKNLDVIKRDYDYTLSEKVRRLFAGECGIGFEDYLYLPKPSVKSRQKILNYENDGYYLCEAEARLIQAAAPALTQALQETKAIYDLGAGSAKAVKSKTAPILKGLSDLRAYHAVDFTHESLKSASQAAGEAFPEVRVSGTLGDIYASGGQNFTPGTALFWGGTLQNTPEKFNGSLPRNTILNLVRLKRYLGNGGHLLITNDATRDQDTLMHAYATPAFDQYIYNFVDLVNRELDIEGLDSADFDVVTRWQPEYHCVATYLSPKRSQTIRLEDRVLRLESGALYHVCSSYKYPHDLMAGMLKMAGYQVSSFINGETDVAIFSAQVV